MEYQTVTVSSEFAQYMNSIAFSAAFVKRLFYSASCAICSVQY